MRIIVSAFSYTILISFLLANSANSGFETVLKATVIENNRVMFDALDTQAPSSFYLEKLTFDSDVFIQKEEFYYLMGLTVNSTVTLEQVKKGCFYLKKKNKFDSATITFYKSSQGIHLHLDLLGLWTCGKIKLRGPFSTNQEWCQYYACQSGDVFDMQKHLHGIAQLENALKSEGYCQAYVGYYLDYIKYTKTVQVTLVFVPRTRFVIDNVSFEENAEGSKDANDVPLPKVKKIFTKRFLKSYYSKGLINRESQKLKDYLYKKGFLNASIELQEVINYDQKTVSLKFVIHFHKKRTFVFVGNHFFSKQNLLDSIFIFGRSLYLLPRSLLVEEIRQAYTRKGFWQVSIDSKQEGERYFFVIQEGPRTKVKNISLKGLASFNEKTLLKKCFYEFKKSSYFEAEILKKALENVIRFYQKQGFWDVKILKQSFEQDIESQEYSIEIVIDEGECRYLADVFIENFPELRSMGPFAKIPHMPIPFDMTFIQEQRQWLIDHFQKQGYWNVVVTPNFVENNNLVNLFWAIQLGTQQVLFGKTVILGNSTFPFSLIMSLMRNNQGKPWNRTVLEQSFDHLRKFDVFSTIYPYTDIIQEQETEKTVFLKLVEDDPFEVRLRGGFQQVSKNLTFRSGTTYKIGGSLTYKNPGNVGDSIFLDADITRFYRNISGTYYRPWNFDRPLALVVKGYDNTYIQPVAIGSDKSLYNATQHGFLVGLSRKYVPVDWGFNVGMELFKTSVVSLELARAINFEPTLVDKKVLYFFVEPNFFVDYLDDQLNPTRGFLSVLSCKGMFPWDRRGVTFFKMLFEQSYFVSIRRLTIGLRARFGHIFNEKFSRVMPSDRFYLGGENSIRAYSPNQAPPLGCFIDENGKKHLVPQGGKTMFNGNIELRFPLFKNFNGGIFQDVGILVEHAKNAVKGGQWLAATGFGVRYNTPIGPLRFDIGWKWRKNELEDSWFACFLTLGHAF